MLSALTGATQVKLESSDDTFLESLSSPLLSPLEIKTEKGYYNHQAIHQVHNNNNINNSIHLSHLGHNNNNNNNNSYSVQSPYNPPPQAHPNQLNGYQHQDFSIHHGHVPPHQHHQYSNYSYNWQQQNNHHSVNQQPQQAPLYGNSKYASSQSNLCAPLSRLMYAPPLTPPSSDPGSPGNSIQVSISLNCFEI